MPKGKILMGKSPKPPVDRLKNSDPNKKKEEILKLTKQAKPKPKSYNMKTYGEERPVDERGFGRVSPRATAPVKKKTRGGIVDPKRRELTPAEQEFLRKQQQLGGAGKNKGGSGKTKPVMPRRGNR